jgi:hypothetical protein
MSIGKTAAQLEKKIMERLRGEGGPFSALSRGDDPAWCWQMVNP